MRRLAWTSAAEAAPACRLWKATLRRGRTFASPSVEGRTLPARPLAWSSAAKPAPCRGRACASPVEGRALPRPRLRVA